MIPDPETWATNSVRNEMARERDQLLDHWQQRAVKAEAALIHNERNAKAILSNCTRVLNSE